MADSTPAGSGGAKDGKGTFGFLARKIGPAPVWLWALVIAGIWFWYSHYGPGASSSAATDPNTGQPYATELAAADQQIADLQSQQTGTGGTPPPSPAPGPPPKKNVPPIPRNLPGKRPPVPATRWRS